MDSFNRMTATGILLKKRNGVFILGIFMAIIFLPCFIESGFALSLQKEGEVIDCGFMFVESFFQESGEIFVDSMMGGIESEDFGFKSISQFEPSPVLLGSLGEGKGKSVSYPSSEKHTDNQRTKADYNVHDLLQSLLGAVIGAAIGVLLICLYFHIYHDASLSQIVLVLGFERLSEYLWLKDIQKPND